MKKVFITYSNDKFKDKQKDLTKQAENLFDKVIEYDPSDLHGTEFYEENKEILDQPQGAGYCLWKPYIILETLKGMDNGDVLFYLDSADTFTNDVLNFIEGHFSSDNNQILLTSGGSPNKRWTKRDCFILMNCDSEKYHNHIQIEAGVIVLKKTDRVVTILNEWLEFCKNKHIVTFMDNVYGENFPEFKEHRYDQSVLTNLAIKHGLPINKLMRKFIKCNVYG